MPIYHLSSFVHVMGNETFFRPYLRGTFNSKREWVLVLKEKYTLRSILIRTSIKVNYLPLNMFKLKIMPLRMLKYDVISATFPKALFSCFLQYFTQQTTTLERQKLK